MPKSRRRKPQKRQKSQGKRRENNSIPTIRAIGITEPTDVLFYRPGKCALCQCKASETMAGISWQGQTISDLLACYFCVKCRLFWMVYMTSQQQLDFMLEAEMDMACDLAQDVFDKPEVV